MAVRPHVLGRYTDRHGRSREVLAGPGAAGSVLVLDRDALTLGDRRLVAHLAADEPAGNAALVCDHYLRDAPCVRGRCRPLIAEDLCRVPPAELDRLGREEERAPRDDSLLDALGHRLALGLVPSRSSIPELRWCRHAPCAGRAPEPLSVRDCVASLEAYEPVCLRSGAALHRHDDDSAVSIATLRAELNRLQASPIVLNRRLREIVIASVETGELSMSEIAARCGRLKRDRRGRETGETSWLARRIGVLAEAGRDRPTPWIHSDVLALIARRGLGIAPREVESP